MKKKISIKATIETKNNFVKINKRTNSNILILEKKFVLPVQKIIKNTPTQNLKNKPFILKKKFTFVYVSIFLGKQSSSILFTSFTF